MAARTIRRQSRERSGGTNIWGNDLGPDGWNGLYSSSVSNWLRSPTIDLSQASETRLSLQRWLQVENASFDQARIRVNGQQVWINPTGSNLIDTSWNEMEIDISAIADGNPSVQIEFSLVTNGSNTFGGWNIDDVSIFSLTSGCPPPTTYCTAKLTSTFNVPVISSGVRKVAGSSPGNALARMAVRMGPGLMMLARTLVFTTSAA